MALKAQPAGSSAERALPDGWRSVFVEDVAHITTGTKNTQDRVADGRFPFFVRSQTVERIDSFSFDGEAVLTAGDGVGTGKIFHYINGKFDVHQRVYRLSDFAAEMNGYFFYLAFSSLFYDRIMQMTAKSSVDSVRREMIARMRIPLPPVHEQEAIAEALSDADALIESLEQLIAKKSLIKQGVMQELLTGKRRLPGFERKPGFKQTEVGSIPEDWQATKLLSLVSVASGQVDPKIKPYRSMVLVAPDHIESKTGRLLARSTAAAQGAISGKYLVAAGDVVYSKIRPHLRKAALVDFDALCSADMYPLRANDGVAPGFIFAVILGEHFSRFAESVSARSGMPKINRTELAEYVCACPPTRDEQAAIGTVLRDMNAEIDGINQRLEKARKLKRGMMQQLLTGRIRLT